MEPISSVTSAWTIAKTAGEVSKKLYEFAKKMKDRDLQHQVDEIADKVRDLKHAASMLEDENRDLREQLRFKGDEFEFRSPFYFEKAHPSQALCPKCFSNGKASPMGREGQSCSSGYRICLVCSQELQIGPYGIS
jgi:hypothetical protein